MKHVISLSFSRIGYFFSKQHVKIRAVRDTATVSMLRHRDTGTAGRLAGFVPLSASVERWRYFHT